MNQIEIPFVGQVVSFGPDNRVFDGLLISGPLIVVLIVFFGRSTVTVALAVGYLLLFVAGVAAEAVEARR